MLMEHLWVKSRFFELRAKINSRDSQMNPGYRESTGNTFVIYAFDLSQVI